MGNVARFDVLGARLYARPLAGTEIPLLKDLQVGATFAMDTNPGLHDPASPRWTRIPCTCTGPTCASPS